MLLVLHEEQDCDDLSNYDDEVFVDYSYERQMVADNLTLIFYVMHTRPNHMEQLLSVIQAYSKTLIADKEGRGNSFEREKKELYYPTALLVLSFIANLQPGLLPFSAWGIQRESSPKPDISSCRRILDSKWENGMCLFEQRLN